MRHANHTSEILLTMSHSIKDISLLCLSRVMHWTARLTEAKVSRAKLRRTSLDVTGQMHHLPSNIVHIISKYALNVVGRAQQSHITQHQAYFKHCQSGMAVVHNTTLNMHWTSPVGLNGEHNISAMMWRVIYCMLSVRSILFYYHSYIHHYVWVAGWIGHQNKSKILFLGAETARTRGWASQHKSSTGKRKKRTSQTNNTAVTSPITCHNTR